MEKTHYKTLRNPHYLGAWALMTGGEPKNMVVEIVKANKEHVQNGDKKEEAMLIHLKNQLPVIVNATNAKAITKALGSPYIEDWVGKRIELTAKKVKAFGEWHEALRVVDVAPSAPTKESLNPNHPSWQKSIDAIKSKAYTIEQIHAKYLINDDHLKELKDAASK